MKKEAIVNFLKELICYVTTLAILSLIFNKAGWTDTSILDNVIGLTIGWIAWRISMIVINRKKK